MRETKEEKDLLEIVHKFIQYFDSIDNDNEEKENE